MVSALASISIQGLSLASSSGVPAHTCRVYNKEGKVRAGKQTSGYNIMVSALPSISIKGLSLVLPAEEPIAYERTSCSSAPSEKPVAYVCTGCTSALTSHLALAPLTSHLKQGQRLPSTYAPFSSLGVQTRGATVSLKSSHVSQLPPHKAPQVPPKHLILTHMNTSCEIDPPSRLLPHTAPSMCPQEGRRPLHKVYFAPNVPHVSPPAPHSAFMRSQEGDRGHYARSFSPSNDPTSHLPPHIAPFMHPQEGYRGHRARSISTPNVSPFSPAAPYSAFHAPAGGKRAATPAGANAAAASPGPCSLPALPSSCVPSARLRLVALGCSSTDEASTPEAAVAAPAAVAWQAEPATEVLTRGPPASTALRAVAGGRAACESGESREPAVIDVLAPAGACARAAVPAAAAAAVAAQPRAVVLAHSSLPPEAPAAVAPWPAQRPPPTLAAAAAAPPGAGAGAAAAAAAAAQPHFCCHPCFRLPRTHPHHFHRHCSPHPSCHPAVALHLSLPPYPEHHLPVMMVARPPAGPTDVCPCTVLHWPLSACGVQLCARHAP
eukprot:1158371-Pelagomonas_calceolata.AAC.1